MKIKLSGTSLSARRQKLLLDLLWDTNPEREQYEADKAELIALDGADFELFLEVSARNPAVEELPVDRYA